uniref:Uncharacterized protein n=1 Tax=Anopheles atroparvus TaxID=41427 RepID=A0A182IY74_ANOAO
MFCCKHPSFTIKQSIENSHFPACNYPQDTRTDPKCGRTRAPVHSNACQSRRTAADSFGSFAIRRKCSTTGGPRLSASPAETYHTWVDRAHPTGPTGSRMRPATRLFWFPPRCSKTLRVLASSPISNATQSDNVCNRDNARAGDRRLGAVLAVVLAGHPAEREDVRAGDPQNGQLRQLLRVRVGRHRLPQLLVRGRDRVDAGPFARVRLDSSLARHVLVVARLRAGGGGVRLAGPARGHQRHRRVEIGDGVVRAVEGGRWCVWLHKQRPYRRGMTLVVVVLVVLGEVEVMSVMVVVVVVVLVVWPLGRMLRRREGRRRANTRSDRTLLLVFAGGGTLFRNQSERLQLLQRLQVDRPVKGGDGRVAHEQIGRIRKHRCFRSASKRMRFFSGAISSVSATTRSGSVLLRLFFTSETTPPTPAEGGQAGSFASGTESSELAFSGVMSPSRDHRSSSCSELPELKPESRSSEDADMAAPVNLQSNRSAPDPTTPKAKWKKGKQHSTDQRRHLVRKNHRIFLALIPANPALRCYPINLADFSLATGSSFTTSLAVTAPCVDLDPRLHVQLVHSFASSWRKGAIARPAHIGNDRKKTKPK